jgi:hypothetical protein
MMYRKLKPDDTTHDGDMYASPCVNVSGKLVKQVVSGCVEILRPIPDEPEDVARVEAEITSYPAGSDEHMMIRVKASAWPRVIPGQHIALLIPRPDPPQGYADSC